jgi:alpha-beta hydrolase superfamily lysophospholipase
MDSTNRMMETTDGQQIFVCEWTQPEFPVANILLIHGLGEHCERYEHVAQYMINQGYTFTSFDLRGHGKTPGLRGHIASFDIVIKDINQLLHQIEQKYPGLPTFVYGHSLGGLLALYHGITQRNNLRGIIATSPGLEPTIPVPAYKIFLAKVMNRIMPAFTLENGLDLDGLSRDKAVVTRYINDPLVHKMVSASLGMDILTKGAWVSARVDEFRVPILIVHGTQDRIAKYAASEKLAYLRPDMITFKAWEGFYHETHNEPDQGQVLSYISEWIRGKIASTK